MANLKDITLNKQENKTQITKSILKGTDTVQILNGEVSITIKNVPNTEVTKIVNGTERK